jgi:hypothetical protein
MAELLSEREVASIQLFTFELSEGEIEALLASLNFILKQADDETLERLTGAYRDELEAIRDDLTLTLKDFESEQTIDDAVVEPT